MITGYHLYQIISGGSAEVDRCQRIIADLLLHHLLTDHVINRYSVFRHTFRFIGNVNCTARSINSNSLFFRIFADAERAAKNGVENVLHHPF